MDNLKLQLEELLEKQLVSSRVLLSSCRFIDENSRKTAAYQDNAYIPFYYHLGKFIAPQKMVEVGFYLGLLSGCFLKSCKSVKRFLAFQEKTDRFYSPRLGASNIQDVFKGDFEFYSGQLTDEKFTAKYTEESWDLAIVNEETQYDKHRVHLDILWEQLNLGGYIVMEYIEGWTPAKDAFNDFCKVKNRDPIRFKTRYGTGIVKK